MRSRLSREIAALAGKSATAPPSTSDTVDISKALSFSPAVSLIEGTVEAKDFILRLGNKKGQHVLIGYQAKQNEFYVDRSQSGDTAFSPNFFPRNRAPRIGTGPVRFQVVADVSAVEVFFDEGLSVLTNLFFPDEPVSSVMLYSPDGLVKTDTLKITELKSIWK